MHKDILSVISRAVQWIGRLVVSPMLRAAFFLLVLWEAPQPNAHSLRPHS